MYIVAIAWLYVVTLMSFTETSVVAGVLTFVFYGLAPVSLLLWLSGAFGKRRKPVKSPEQESPQDGGDSEPMHRE